MRSRVLKESYLFFNNLFNEKVLLAHSDLAIPETEWIKPWSSCSLKSNLRDKDGQERGI